jgi:hypothetical protein
LPKKEYWFILWDEEVSILGLDPVGKYLPPAGFKSRNNKALESA